MHIGNGMYGLILVEPKDGLPEGGPRVLRDAGRVLHKGETARTGLSRSTWTRATDEQPSTWCSTAGGRADGRQGAHGEGRARRYGSSSARRPEPDSQLPRDRRDLRQRLSRGRHAARTQCADHPHSRRRRGDRGVRRRESRATYILVDHSIFRAFNKGALGMMTVTGTDAPKVYASVKGGLGGKE